MGLVYADRSEYAREITKLSLWFASDASRSASGFRQSLTAQTPVYRLTMLWDGQRHPAGGHIDEAWEGLLDRVSRDVSEGDLEEEGFRLFWPVIEPRIERDIEAWPWIPETYGVKPTGTGEFGFFLYELPSDNRGEDPIELHMGNALSPSSPFEDLNARASELHRLLEDARRRNPRATRIRTDSWLNHHPLFLSLFPEEWSLEKRPSRLGYWFNWWGQFVNRHGGFHAGNGARFRRERSFPYPSVSCECGIPSLRAHLRSAFAF